MPVMDGMNLANKIKESKVGNCKVMMVSGNDIDEKIRESLTEKGII